MAQITREQIDQWAQQLIEQGGTHVPSCDQDSHVTTPDFPVSMRQQIYFAVVSAGRAVTRREVARMVNRKSTGWINGHLDALVRQGYLTRTEYAYRDNMPVYYYEVVK